MVLSTGIHYKHALGVDMINFPFFYPFLNDEQCDVFCLSHHLYILKLFIPLDCVLLA